MNESGVGTPYIPLDPRRKRGVLLGACILWFYSLLFAFTMPVVFPSLMRHYDMLGWLAILSALSSLFSCLVTPIGGKLGDRFGRRMVCLIAGYARLALMVACAIPTNGPTFLVLYSLGNFAGGLVNAYPATILSDVTTREERPKWFGIFGTINGASLLLGLLGGGLIVDHLGPFSTFWFFAPFGLAALVLLTVCYPNHPDGRRAPIDWVGIGLLGAGLCCVLAWCALGGSLLDRTSPPGLGVLALGVVLLALLLRWEQRCSDPILDLKLFRNRNFAMSFSAHLLVAPMMCLCSSVLALFGQVGLGLTATVSGTLALPKNILFLILPTFLGTWVGRSDRRFRTAFFGCGAAISIASLLAAFWNVQTPIWVIYAVMLIFGLGTSLQAVSIQPYMQMAVDPKDMGIAAALLLFANSIGVVLFNAFYNIFYNAKYQAAIETGGEALLPDAIAETFSAMAILSCVCGAILCAAALLLIPARRTAPATLPEQPD